MTEQIKIERLDKTELLVLKSAHKDGFGYMPSDPYKERYLLMQKEGLVKNNPEEKWSEHGWHDTLTEKGKEYYDEFFRVVRNKHGHIWKKSEYDNDKIDNFGYEAGEYHNGPVCILCGFGFCEHCKTELDIPKCSTDIKEKMELLKQLNNQIDSIKETIK